MEFKIEIGSIKKVYFEDGSHDFVLVEKSTENGFFVCSNVSKKREKVLVHPTRLKYANNEEVEMCLTYLDRLKEETK